VVFPQVPVRHTLKLPCRPGIMPDWSAYFAMAHVPFSPCSRLRRINGLFTVSLNPRPMDKLFLLSHPWSFWISLLCLYRHRASIAIGTLASWSRMLCYVNGNCQAVTVYARLPWVMKPFQPIKHRLSLKIFRRSTRKHYPLPLIFEQCWLQGSMNFSHRFVHNAVAS
jgi:hypothetical protein